MVPYVLKKREMDSEARGYYIVVDHGNGYVTL
jgi:murein DD-endopeptidase MepM/ murein hydrolase activator NlpD